MREEVGICGTIFFVTNDLNEDDPAYSRLTIEDVNSMALKLSDLFKVNCQDDRN